MLHTNHTHTMPTLPAADVHHEYRLKPGLRIVRTRAGWNLWDDFAGDTVKRESCSTLPELLHWIGDDPMLVTDITRA